MPGVEVLNETFFNEFTIRVPGDAPRAWSRSSRAQGVLGGVPCVAPRCRTSPSCAISSSWPSTEVNTDEDRAAYAKALKEVLA